MIRELYNENCGPLRGFPGYNSACAKTNADSIKSWVVRLCDENHKLPAPFQELINDEAEFEKLKKKKEATKLANQQARIEKEARNANHAAHENSLGLRPLPVSATTSDVSSSVVSSVHSSNHDTVSSTTTSSVPSSNCVVHVDLCDDGDNNENIIPTNLLQIAAETSLSVRTARKRKSDTYGNGTTLGKATMSGARTPGDPIHPINQATVAFDTMMNSVAKSMNARNNGNEQDLLMSEFSDDQKVELKKLKVIGQMFATTNPSLVDDQAAELYKTAQRDFVISVLKKK